MLASVKTFQYGAKIIFKAFTAQSHKMVKHTQTIRRQIADELFECVWLFCEIGAWKVKSVTRNMNQKGSRLKTIQRKG